jgi:4-hydroxyphenylpyruvate dioxygenase
MSNAMGITGYDYVEFYVGSAKATAFWHAKAMGMQITAYAGPETGVRDRCSYLLTQGTLRILITAPLQPSTYDVLGYTNQHGDSVKRWCVRVKDVKASFKQAVKNGAVPVRKPTRTEDEDGVVEEAAIRIYDDTELGFTNYDQYNGLFRPGYGAPIHDCELHFEDTGLQRFDHIVGNVRENEMNYWAEYFNRTMDFETFIDFGPGDITTEYSALLSKVVRTKDELIKNPINEPYAGRCQSQIEEYLHHHYGAGIQHIALESDNVMQSIQALRENGVEFLSVPDTYYEELRRKNDTLPEQLMVTEDIGELQKLGILCDHEGSGYLLQLFTKPIGDRPTFFYEIIQRRNGAQGFGQGNFQALFESIEHDQARRGNLLRRN